MNNNFTKEYIKECDCKEIQGLRAELEFDDKILWNRQLKTVYYKVISPNSSNFIRNNAIWLPTGDQLDEEIIKICREKNSSYFYSFIPNINKFTVWLNPNFLKIQDEEINPLIAKIKLLKELLK